MSDLDLMLLVMYALGGLTGIFGGWLAWGGKGEKA